MSPYYIALEVQASYQGMEIVFDRDVWDAFPQMSPKALGKEMLGWAAHVQAEQVPASRSWSEEACAKANSVRRQDARVHGTPSRKVAKEATLKGLGQTGVVAN